MIIDINEANRDNWVLVHNITKKQAKRFIAKSPHDVKVFCPDYIRKAFLSHHLDIIGLFNTYDRKNPLALSVVVKNFGPNGNETYLNELAGFRRGGCGVYLVEQLCQVFRKLWLQCGLKELGNDRYAINDELADGVYRRISYLKEYIVQNSIWNCPANFFYYGIDDKDMADFLEKTYGKDSGTN